MLQKKTMFVAVMVILSLAIILFAGAFNADVEAQLIKSDENGIQYDLDVVNKTAKVHKISNISLRSPEKLEIPESYMYEGESYSVTEIGQVGNTPGSYKAVSEIIIPNTVVKINSSAFAQTSNLKKITIGSGVEYIGSSAFAIQVNTNKLESITFSENSKLKTIEANAFKNCKNLSNIDLPDSVEYIGDNAFYYVSSTVAPKSVIATMGKNVTFIGNSAFYNINITSIVCNENKSNASPYYSDDGVLYKKSESDCVLVTYPMGSDRTEFIIPKEVTSLGYRSFQYMYGLSTHKLTKLSFEEGSKLKSIGDEALFQTKIDEIVIPKDVQLIGESAFANASNLKKVIFENDGSVPLFIGDKAFSSTVKIASVLEEVHFSKDADIVSIGNSSFGGGQYTSFALKQFGPEANKITIPSTVKTIGDGAFSMGNPSNPTDIISIIFLGDSQGKSNTTSIGASAFNMGYAVSLIDIEKCSGLTELKVGSFSTGGDVDNVILKLPQNGSLVKISDLALNLKKPLKTNGSYEIMIPASVTIIGNQDPFTNASKVSFADGSLIEVIDTNSFLAGKDEENLIDLDLSNCINLKKIVGFSLYYDKYQKLKFAGGTIFEKNIDWMGKNSDMLIFSGDNKRVYGDVLWGKVTYDAAIEKYSVSASETIDITTDVVAINASYFAGPVTSITSSGDNQYFFVDEGGKALYAVRERDSDGRIIKSVLFKVRSDVIEFNVPEHVKMIHPMAFVGCNSLETVRLVGTETLVPAHTFSGIESMKRLFTNTPSLYFDEDAFSSVTYITGYKWDPNMDGAGNHVSEKITLIETKPDYILINTNDTTEIGVFKKWSEVGIQYKSGERKIYLISSLSNTTIAVNSETIVIDFGGGYTSYDVTVECKTIAIQSSQYGSKGIYSTSGFVDEDIVFIKPKLRDNGSVTITFDPNGGTFSDSSFDGKKILPSGLTIIDDEIPVVIKDGSKISDWFMNGVHYDFNTPLSGDIKLVAQWVTRDPMISVLSKHGIVQEENGFEIVGSKLVNKGDVVKLICEPFQGYEFIKWNYVDGVVKKSSTERILTLTIDADVIVEPQFRYYASSMGLPSIIDLDKTPTISDLKNKGLVQQWKVGGHLDTSMAVWTGGVSVPLVVDNYVYVRQADHIYRIEVDTGYVVNAVDSVTVTSYYHSLIYGGGCIIDQKTNKAYDLELKQMFVINETLNSAFYHDGYFYAESGGKLYKFTSIDDNPDSSDEVKTMNVVSDSIYNGSIGNYGTIAEPVFVDGYIYMLSSSGNQRFIISVNLENGTTDVITLDRLFGHLFDDGWLTHHEGRLYLTSYTVGLFGDRTAPGNSIITSVAIDKGKFSDPKYTEVKAGAASVQSILSKFVIFNERGYLNGVSMDGKAYFMVYNVEGNGNLSQIYYETSTQSHGSLVVDISNATSENNNEVTVYLIPYLPEDKLYVFSDNSTKVTANKAELLVLKDWERQYNSQAVRFGPNGQLIWYNDSGKLFSYTVSESNDYYFFLKDGRDGKWIKGTGSNPADAAPSEYISLSNGTLLGADIAGNNNFSTGWSAYALANAGDWSSNDYDMLNQTWIMQQDLDLQNSVYKTIHYWIITKDVELSVTDSEWTYSEGTYNFADNIGDDRSIVGEILTLKGQEMMYVVTLNLNGGASTTVTVDNGWAYDNVNETWSKTFQSGEAFPQIADPTKTGEGVTYVFESWSEEFPSTVTESKTYTAIFTERPISMTIEYGMSVTKSDDSPDVATYNVVINRIQGTSNIENARLLVIVDYNNGSFINVYSKIDLDTDGNAYEVVKLSTAGMTGLRFDIVSGFPNGEYDNYGTWNSVD